jgi:hypothetical protein
MRQVVLLIKVGCARPFRAIHLPTYDRDRPDRDRPASAVPPAVPFPPPIRDIRFRRFATFNRSRTNSHSGSNFVVPGNAGVDAFVILKRLPIRVSPGSRSLLDASAERPCSGAKLRCFVRKSSLFAQRSSLFKRTEIPCSSHQTRPPLRRRGDGKGAVARARGSVCAFVAPRRLTLP